MQELGIENIEMTGDALTWFRALAGSMDPELAVIPPGELFARGYPAHGPAWLADAREAYHFDGGRPFSLASPRAFGALLHQIHDNRCANTDTCAVIRKFLLGQQLQTHIPKFGWGVSCAHKTGSFQPFISSDMGIFTPAAGCPVIIVLMSQRHRGQRAMLDDCLARMGELVIHAAETQGK